MYRIPRLSTIPCFLLLLCVAVSLTGCNDYNVYSLEMTPRGRVVERKLSCWRVGQKDNKNDQIVEFSEAELASIAKLYGVATPANGPKKHHFAKRFIGELPADVGGRAAYSHNKTPMGTTTIYVERFRGSDDVKRTMDEREQAVDEIVDLLTGWFQREMNSDADFAKMKPFLNRELRHDLKNLLRYLGLAENSAPYDKQAGEDVVVRIGMYLLERGYFTVKQVPDIARATKGDELTATRLVRRLLANKMGATADKPVPKSLDFLSDFKRIEKSWDEYIVTTPQYRILLDKWIAARPEERGERPNPDKVSGSLALRATVGFLEFGRSDRLEVRMNCPEKPWQTNGKWDDDEKQVVWSSDLARASQLPTLCHAMWAVADVSFQKKHFGKVVLVGDELQAFNLWRGGLTERETEEWERFVSSLSPNGPLGKQIREFRFSNEPAKKEKAKLSGVARNLVLRGLSAKSE